MQALSQLSYTPLTMQAIYLYDCIVQSLEL